MSVFTADCARCGTKSVAFTITAEARTGRYEWDTFAICGNCERASVAAFLIENGPPPLAGKPTAPPHEIKPSPRRRKPPPGTPDPVDDYFMQGVDCLRDSRWDAAGAMFRKALETAMKIRDPSGEGNLWQMIDAAAKDGRLPSEPAEMAHKIRDLGNEAAHGQFTEPNAHVAYRFTEMMLLYLFTLPDMLEKARETTQDAASGSQ